MELNSWFIVMTTDEILMNRPKVSSGFSVIFWFSRLRTFRFALKFSTEISNPYSLFPPQSGFSEIMVSSWQSCCTSNLHPLCGVNTSFALILRGQISEARMFSSSSRSATIISLFHIPPAINAYLRNIPGKLSCQIGGALTGLVKKSDNIQPLLQKELLCLEMVLRIAFHKEFSHLPRGLGHIANSSSIP